MEKRERFVKEDSVRTMRIVYHIVLCKTKAGAEKKQQSADSDGCRAYNDVIARICVPNPASLYIKERTRETSSDPLQGSVEAHTVTVRINKGICRNARRIRGKYVIRTTDKNGRVAFVKYYFFICLCFSTSQNTVFLNEKNVSIFCYFRHVNYARRR